MSFLGLKVSVLLNINSKGIAWLLPNFNKSCEYKDAIGPIYELEMMMAMDIRMMTGKDLYCDTFNSKPLWLHLGADSYPITDFSPALIQLNYIN